MKIKKITILGLILGTLFLVLWLIIPVKYEVDNFEKLSQYYDSLQIIYPYQGDNFRYTINNIGIPVALKRYANLKYNKFPNIEWIKLLQTIGHYDEAQNYLEEMQYNNCLIKDFYFNNENCLNRGTKTNRAKIIGCIIKADLSDMVHIKDNENIRKDEIAELKQENLNNKEDIIISNKKLEKPSLYCENKNIQSQGRNCGYISSISYFIQEGQFDEANNLLIQLTKEYKYTGKIIDLHMRLGLEYTKKQEYKKAILLFEKVLEYQDYNYKAHEKLSECYEKIGNIQKSKYHQNIMKQLLTL